MSQIEFFSVPNPIYLTSVKKSYFSLSLKLFKKITIMDQGEEGTQQFVNEIENTYDGVHDGFLLQIIRNGSIRECNHKITGVKCAVNCIDLALVPGEEQLERLRANIRSMRELEDHPNILRLEEVYESTDNFYLVYESYSGGDLFEDLDKQMD